MQPLRNIVQDHLSAKEQIIKQKYSAWQFSGEECSVSIPQHKCKCSAPCTPGRDIKAQENSAHSSWKELPEVSVHMTTCFNVHHERGSTVKGKRGLWNPN